MLAAPEGVWSKCTVICHALSETLRPCAGPDPAKDESRTADDKGKLHEADNSEQDHNTNEIPGSATRDHREHNVSCRPDQDHRDRGEAHCGAEDPDLSREHDATRRDGRLEVVAKNPISAIGMDVCADYAAGT